MAKMHQRAVRLGRIKRVGTQLSKLKKVDPRCYRIVMDIIRQVLNPTAPGKSLKELTQSKNPAESKIAEVLLSSGFPDKTRVCTREIRGPVKSPVPAVAFIAYGFLEPQDKADRAIVFVGELLEGKQLLPL